jgi:hypothetical protein
MQPHSMDALLENAYGCIVSAKPNGQNMDKISWLLQHAAWGSTRPSRCRCAGMRIWHLPWPYGKERQRTMLANYSQSRSVLQRFDAACMRTAG